MQMPTITCGQYRSGRRLLALKLQLEDKNIDPRLRAEIQAEIESLEEELGLD